MTRQLGETKAFIEGKLPGFMPEIALVIGSGLSGVTAAIENPATIAYASIPHFPRPTVAGHAGQMIFGTLAGKKMMVLSGRFHFYEGRSLAEITYPICVVAALGVNVLIVTNAAGGINSQFTPGDLMIIEDHINFMGVNPLVGSADGPRFSDMTEAYSVRLREKLASAAGKLGLPVRRGVYLATTGPSYETPAEIRAFGRLGADAVGMSTVPEVIMARHHEIEVAGISCITNLAAGITGEKLSHEEVLETWESAQEKLTRLLTEFIGTL